MNILLQDLRYGLRSLYRQPLFTAVAVLVLGLGIGANTAVFSVINAVLLRPLPYPDPDRIVLMREATKLFDFGSVSLPNYLDWRAAQRSFTDLSIYTGTTYNLAMARAADVDAPERVHAVRASANYLSVLGIHPVLGRDLTEADDVPGSGRVALISDSLWRRHFHADPKVISQHPSIMLDSQSYEIVGVLPPTLTYPRRAEVLTPLAGARKDPETMRRDNHPGFSVLGRLRENVTLDAARDNLSAIAKELERRYPDSNTGRGIKAKRLLEANVGSYRHALYLLLGAVGCVLLIACANVANLQLARAAGRTRELAVRAALGAGRGRLVRQLLTESTVLGLLGGALGVLLALWALDTIVALAPPGVPRFQGIRLDWTALGFAAVTALGTGLLVGVWPAWRISGIATMAVALHEGNARGGTGGASRVRARSMLVVVQVAMAVVLLAGAGLALRSFWGLQSLPLGFRPEGVLTVAISLPGVRYKQEKAGLFFDELLARVRALPGVAAAATGVNTPFDGNEWDSGVHITGTPPDAPGDSPSAEMNYVSPDYFKVMGMPIRAGRDFDGREVFGKPKSVIVDESFVRKFFPGQDPLGKSVDDDQTNESNPPPMTIVGVVPRTRNDMPGERSFLDEIVQMHLASAQSEVGDRRLMVRVVSGDPKRLIEPIRQAVLTIDPEIPIAEAATLEESIAESMTSQRLTMTLLGTFAVLALVLATLGLYGVMALSVTQRTRELGIRLALGAPRTSVLGLVLRQGVTLVGVGLAVGIVCAWAAGRLLSSVLYGVGGSDPVTLGTVSSVLAGAALLACWLPARRATRVDPLVALREE